MSSGPILTASGLYKTYGEVHALTDAHLTVGRGAVAGLVGKNGAGKSTMIRLVTGTEAADRGAISFDGTDLLGASVKEVVKRGVVAVPQESAIWPSLSVAENVLLPDLYERQVGRNVAWRKSEAVAASAMARVGLTADPGARAGTLGVPAQRRLMIARALARDPRLLVLDEPTEAFTEAEVDSLFSTLTDLVRDGMSVLYVSHRLNEVLQISDTVTVISDGRNVLSAPTAEIDREQLVRAIVGERQFAMEADVDGRGRITQSSDKPALELRGLAGGSVRGVDLTVAPGEVIGLYGLAGAGRSGLLHCVAGSRSATSGRVVAGGRDVTGTSLRQRRRAGMFFLGEDRRAQGLLPSLSVRENTVLGGHRHWLPRPGLKRRERHAARQALDRVGYTRRDLETTVSTLSGGNQQKVLLARGLVCNARLWLLDEPTIGLDVGARAELFATLRSVVDGQPDAAAILVMSDYDDLRAATDRVVVLRHGRIVGEVAADQLTEAGLLHLASFGEPATSTASTSPATDTPEGGHA